jgi:hypothetical protein
MISKVKISDGAKIKCNYELCGKMVSKSNLQSKTPSIVTHIQYMTTFLMGAYLTRM